MNAPHPAEHIVLAEDEKKSGQQTNGTAKELAGTLLCHSARE